jgi:hypothetical protein
VIRLRTGLRVLYGTVRAPAQYGISYPKSGRTWLRAMIGHVLCGRAGLPETQVLNTRVLTAALGLPVMKWHHGGASLKNPCPDHDALSLEQARFRGKHVLFMMRDPRDTLVSAYFQALKRELAYEGEIAEYVRSGNRGILKWIAFHNMWHEHRPQLASFQVVRYESLHADTAGTLRTALRAIGLQDVDDRALADAVEFARFDNLRRLETSGRMRAAALRPKDPSDPNSFKVRKGRVGGHRETLSENDIAYIEETLRRVPCPLYLEHYPQS